MKLTYIGDDVKYLVCLLQIFLYVTTLFVVYARKKRFARAFCAFSTYKIGQITGRRPKKLLWIFLVFDVFITFAPEKHSIITRTLLGDTLACYYRSTTTGDLAGIGDKQQFTQLSHTEKKSDALLTLYIMTLYSQCHYILVRTAC